MRSAINYLQSSASTTEHIKKETIYSVSNAAQPKDIINLIDACLAGNFLDARKHLETLLFDQGLSGEDIISQLYKKIVSYPEDKLCIKSRIQIIDKIAEINFRLVEGANDRIQLEALLSQIILINHIN
jgi:replication factor C small subunit